MIDKILFINDNEAKIKLSSNDTSNKDLINLHLVFDDNEHKILGEINQVENDIISVQFLGEFKDADFIPGTIKKPKLNSNVRNISNDELDIIMGTKDKKSFSCGTSVLYQCPVNINVDSLFNNHIAIFGNTGSGKSYGVAKLLQSLCYSPNNIAVNSTILLFDTHDEYTSAFKNLNLINHNYQFKLYAKSLEKENANLISLPIWLLDIEDIACLLEATEYSQLAIIEKALFVLSIITKHDAFSNKYKNHIIAKSIQSLMYSNLTAAEIRSHIFEILTISSTNEINLNIEVPGIGYKRPFRKCFDINKNETFAEGILVGEYIEKFIDDNLEKAVSKTIEKCNLKDLEDALSFVVISENVLNNGKLFNDAMMLKMKLHSLILNGYDKYFEYQNYVNLEEFVIDLVTISQKVRSQIIAFNIEGFSDHFAYFITRTYSKLMFSFVTRLKVRASIPIHIFLEEAHRYINNNFNSILGNNVFESIAKEGRKFGMILALISQRPTELSETVLSQCSSFLLFRTNHPRDLEYMKRAIPNINLEIIEKQRSIQPGYFVGLGKAFKIPMIVKLDTPTPTPQSNNANVFDIWSGHIN
jgi:ABC-type dipeptide/oligopeptide/nickel transport system ATPase component